MPIFKKPDYPMIILPILAIISFLFLVILNKDPLKLNSPKYYSNSNQTPNSNKPNIRDDLDTVSLNSLFEETKNKIQDYKGTYGLYIKDIGSGAEFEYNSKEVFYGASLYKIPVAAALMKELEAGNITGSDKIVYYPYDYVSGTGVIQNLPFGSRVRVDTVLTELIKNSDNVSQAMIIRTLGYDKIMRAFSELALDKESNNFYNLNNTFPKEIGHVFEKILYGDYLEYSSKEYLMGLMYPTSFDDRVSPYIGAGYTFRHKIGSWNASWHDCGVVYGNNREVIVCLMSKSVDYTDFLSVAKLTGEFVNRVME